MGDASGASTSASPPSPRSTAQKPGRQPSTTTRTLANGSPSPSTVLNTTTHSQDEQLTALQQHVLFWDRDNDGVIYPTDVYRGFRALGFSVLFSLGSLLIPFFFSYATTLARSYVPDYRYRIYVSSIHKAKHGSDTGVFTVDGHFDDARFDAIFARYDITACGGLSADELLIMWRRNRCAADPAGWAFAFMETWTTWLLLQEDGRVWKDDLRACYDGTLFWRISELYENGEEWSKGYGVGDFLEGMWLGGTWRNWELKQKKGN